MPITVAVTITCMCRCDGRAWGNIHGLDVEFGADFCFGTSRPWGLKMRGWRAGVERHVVIGFGDAREIGGGNWVFWFEFRERLRLLIYGRGWLRVVGLCDAVIRLWGLRLSRHCSHTFESASSTQVRESGTRCNTIKVMLRFSQTCSSVSFLIFIGLLSYYVASFPTLPRFPHLSISVCGKPLRFGTRSGATYPKWRSGTFACWVFINPLQFDLWLETEFICHEL